MRLLKATARQTLLATGKSAIWMLAAAVVVASTIAGESTFTMPFGDADTARLIVMPTAVGLRYLLGYAFRTGPWAFCLMELARLGMAATLLTLGANWTAIFALTEYRQHHGWILLALGALTLMIGVALVEYREDTAPR